MMNDVLVALLLVGAVAFMLFLLFREFWTWYWKQSQQLALLQSIDASLKALAESRRPTPAAPAGPAPSGWSSVPASISPAPAPFRP